MIVIWKIIRNFALEKFSQMPMKYRHNKVLHHLNSSTCSLLENSTCKQVQSSKTSERKHTHSSFNFHLFFLCLIFTHFHRFSLKCLGLQVSGNGVIFPFFTIFQVVP